MKSNIPKILNKKFDITWGSIPLFLASYFLLLHLYTNMYLFIGLFTIFIGGLLFFLYKIAGVNTTIKFKIPAYILSILLIVVSIFLVSYYTYTIYNEIDILRDPYLYLILKSVGLYLFYLFIALSISSIYITASIVIGSYIYKGHKISWDTIYLQFIVGLAIIGNITLYLLWFGILSKQLLALLLVIFPVFLYLRRDKIIFIYNKLTKLLRKETSIDTNIFKFTIYISIFIAFASILARLPQSFIGGTDGLRTYMHLPYFIINEGNFPINTLNLTFPYFIEILSSPFFAFNNIAIGRATFYLISMMFIPGFIIFLKNIDNNPKKIFKILLVIFMCPFLFRIIGIEFKIDPYILTFGSALLIILSKKLKYTKSDLITISIIISTLILIKLNLILVVIPFSIYLLHKLIKTKKLRNLSSFLVASLIILLPWIYMYTRDVPYLGYSNSTITTLLPSIFAKQNADMSDCYNNIVLFEQNTDAGFTQTVLGYLKIPLILNSMQSLKPDSNLNPFLIIMGAGIFISLVMTIHLLFKDKLYRKYLYIFLPGLLIGFLSTPVYPWYYMLPLLSLVSVGLMLNKNKKLMNIIMIYPILFIPTVIAYPQYWPLTFTNDDIVYQRSNENKFIEGFFEISGIINQDPTENILFLTGITWYNVNWGIDNYYNRVYFLDYLSKNPNEELSGVIKKYDIKYVIDNLNYEDPYDYQCLLDYKSKTNQKLKELNKVFENEYFIIYEVGNN